jgi:hypothetical protein
MANKQIFQLDAKPTPSLTDVIPLQDAAGSADAKKVTLSAVQSALTGKEDALGFTPEDVANKSTDGNFAANSDILYPSQKAAKTYADSLAVGLLRDRGNYDASSNLFPSTGGSGTGGAVKAGDLWYISVAGTLGGTSVLVGYSVRALVDSPAQTPTNWSILNVGLGFVPENVANKSTNVNLGTSNTLYPTQNAVKAYVDGKPVPTLDEVLTAGNTSNLEIGVGKINVFDAGFSTFGQVAFNADTYTFLDSLPNDIFSVKDGEINIFSNAGTIAAKIESNLLSVSRTFNLPNKNGTFAMLDDITTGVEGVTGFGVDNTDPLNPKVNKYTNTVIGATGTDMATATLITSVWTVVNSTTSTSAGVKLPSNPSTGDKYYVRNNMSTINPFSFILWGNGVEIKINTDSNPGIPFPTSTDYVYSFTYDGQNYWIGNQEQVVESETSNAFVQAAGTNLSTATLLTANFNTVTLAPSNSGVKLPNSPRIGDTYHIMNTVGAFKVYGNGNDIYYNQSASSSVIIPYLGGGVPQFIFRYDGNLGWFMSQEQVTPHLTFRALLEQSGTSAPTVTILENTLGDLPTFSYFSQGNFLATFSNSVYTGSKTFIKIGSTAPSYADSVAIAYVYGGSGNQIMVNTRAGGTNVNGALLFTSLEILVYP